VALSRPETCNLSCRTLFFFYLSNAIDASERFCPPEIPSRFRKHDLEMYASCGYYLWILPALFRTKSHKTIFFFNIYQRCRCVLFGAANVESWDDWCELVFCKKYGSNVFHVKETYLHVKRDLYMCQRRPLYLRHPGVRMTFLIVAYDALSL